jgi:hypothetical protein
MRWTVARFIDPNSKIRVERFSLDLVLVTLASKFENIEDGKARGSSLAFLRTLVCAPYRTTTVLLTSRLAYLLLLC